MLKHYFQILSIGLLSTTIVLASEGGPSLSLHYEYYQDANEVSSQTPGFDLVAQIAKHWTVQVAVEVDAVTGASRVASVNALDGVTKASGTPSLIDGFTGASTVEFRKSQTSHITYNNEGSIVSLGYYTSFENDYFSHAPMFDISQDFFGRNTTVGYSVSYYNDKFVEPLVNSPEGSADKNLISNQLSITQSFTPQTLGSVTAQRIDSWGYLSKPYNPVVVPGVNPYDSTEHYIILDEVLPDRKTAYAFSGTLVQGFHLFSEDLLGSLRLYYRYYDDSWDLQSHTMQAELSQYLTDAFYIRLRYRLYDQTRANFVYASYTDSSEYRTSDIKFYPFTSHLIGVKLGGAFPDEWVENYSWMPDHWNIKTDYSFRNTQGNPLLYQFYATDSYYQQLSIMTGVDYAF